MIFGKEIYAEIRAKNEVHDHDSKHDEMVFLGESKNGTQMYLNKAVAEDKKVIVSASGSTGLASTSGRPNISR